jgi:E3 ubiquitin-protein ligase MARCH6
MLISNSQMKPKRLLFLLHMPIKAVRLITDPVVDVILWFIRPALSHLYSILKEVWKLKTSGTAKSRISLDQLYHRATWRLQQFTPPLHKTSHSPTSPSIVHSFIQSAYNATTRYVPRLLLASFSTAHSKHEPIADSDVFSAIRTLAASFATFWRRAAVDDGPREQIFAIWLGYVAIICSALLFLRSGVMLNGATRVIRNIIAQQLIVIKVR